MKKLYYSAVTYMALSLISGVFFREFTKLNGVYETTALGKVHGHLFSLGFLFFLAALLFEKISEITKDDLFQFFFITYHIGLGVSTAAMTARGILSVLELKGSLVLSSGLNASVSGISGMGHIIMSIGLVLFVLILKNRLLKPAA